MTAINDLSDLINRMTGGSSGAPENIFFFKDSRVGAAVAAAAIVGRLSSLWQYNGSPSDGAAPGAVAVPTNATTGGLRQTDPAGGTQKWLIGGAAVANSTGMLVLYDRLLHISGFSGTSTSAQNVGGALTRYTNGLGNQIWVEVYTQIGASSTTITAAYTNQAVAAKTSIATAIGNTGFREAQRIILLPLAAGDNGVQGVTSVTLAATTGTAGDFGVTIAHPLLCFPLASSGVGAIRSLIGELPSMPEILTDACLAWVWYPGTTTAPNILGSLHFIEK